jgi:hypothetical protein
MGILISNLRATCNYQPYHNISISTAKYSNFAHTYAIKIKPDPPGDLEIEFDYKTNVSIEAKDINFIVQADLRKSKIVSSPKHSTGHIYIRIPLLFIQKAVDTKFHGFIKTTVVTNRFIYLGKIGHTAIVFSRDTGYPDITYTNGQYHWDDGTVIKGGACGAYRVNPGPFKSNPCPPPSSVPVKQTKIPVPAKTYDPVKKQLCFRGAGCVPVDPAVGKQIMEDNKKKRDDALAKAEKERKVQEAIAKAKAEAAAKAKRIAEQQRLARIKKNTPPESANPHDILNALTSKLTPPPPPGPTIPRTPPSQPMPLPAPYQTLVEHQQYQQPEQKQGINTNMIIIGSTVVAVGLIVALSK